MAVFLRTCSDFVRPAHTTIFLINLSSLALQSEHAKMLAQPTSTVQDLSFAPLNSVRLATLKRQASQAVETLVLSQASQRVSSLRDWSQDPLNAQT